MEPCILVVDDDREIVQAIAILLEKEGYRVLRAYNGLEALELAARPRWTLCYLLHPCPEQPARSAGPFPSLAAGLNAKGSRRARCPVCGEPFLIQTWQFCREGTYYADLPCRQHGHFVARLTLSAPEEGRWTGELAVPSPTPELLRDFGLARRGEVHLCRGGRRNRRRRRGKRKERASREGETEYRHARPQAHSIAGRRNRDRGGAAFHTNGPAGPSGDLLQPQRPPCKRLPVRWNTHIGISGRETKVCVDA